MIKKQLLVILATIVLSFNSFSQTPITISTANEFLSVIEQGLSENYIQTADIVLGDLGTLTEAIINGTFSGTYDGNGYSISYSAAFVGPGGANSLKGRCFGLFEKVTGTIKNLNIVNSYATLSGNGKTMNIGLICGLLGADNTQGHIINCHVMGDVNSSVTPDDKNGSDAALIAGEVIDGEIYCCSGIGNVSGVGYAGGITGHFKKGSIKGCSFVGSVKAVLPQKYYGNPDPDNNDDKRNAGAYAGGIAGLTYGGNPSSPTEISLSYVNAEIEGAIGARGITNANYNYNNNYPNNTITTINVTDCFAKGTVTAKGEGTNQGNTDQTTMITSEIDSDNEVASGVSNYTTIYNSAEDDLESNGSTTKSTLNGERDAKDKTNFYFSRETGEVILVYGQNIGCEKPEFEAEIKRTNSYGNYTYYYEVTFAESGTYEFTLKKGSEIIDSRIKANTDTIRIELGRGRNNNTLINSLANGEYEFSAKRHCTSEDDQQSTSSIATYVSFLTVRDGNNNQNSTLGMGDKQCAQPTSLSVSTTPTSATIAIEGFEANQAFRYNIDNEDYITGTGNTISLTGLNENIIYTVRVQRDCGNGNYSLPFTIEFITPTLTPTPPPSDYETIKDGLFNSPSTWNTNIVPDGENDNITIKHYVQLTHKLTLSGTTMLTIDDNSNDDNTETAILLIDQLGQLINMTDNDILGIVEVKTPINQQKQWAFIGAPFMTNNIKKYRLETIVPVRGSDVVVSLYDDEGQDWITDPYANYTSIVETGKGYFGYPLYTGAVTFTTYGDLWDFSLNNGQGGMKEYSETPALYKLNKENVTVAGQEGGFLPLSNPYPAKLSVSKFLQGNTFNIQGQGVYKFNNSTQDFPMNPNGAGEIDIAEGFFVKLADGVSSIEFSQSQLTAYQPTIFAKSAVEREFIELSLVQNNHASKLYFAHNEQAEQGYDIFDADKLFAMTEMTEPYFVTDGISLVKEEVAELPYYATMNVRSFEHDSVSFVANNIPEGYSVSIIDGEETIELTENSAYSTLVSRGENANRFKLLIKKSVGLGEVEELEVEITNSNRLVNVSSTEEDLQIEVYNALGQKVFATKERNFTLNNVSAGAYVVKAFNNTASKTQKIVIK
jgi:hypothetical protein